MKLIFVYNAKSGLANAMLDVSHKIISPRTYKCSLCDLTFGAFSEKEVWKRFRNSSGLKMNFLHYDEFEELFTNDKFDYPVVLLEHDEKLEVKLDSSELKRFKSVSELMDAITALIHSLNQPE